MPQSIEHATWQLYETFHIPVNVRRDLRTYDHFSSAHARSLRQEQLLTTYFTQMVDAIRRDLETQDGCWLLEAILQREIPAIHLLDHSAIAYVYAAMFTPDELPRLDAFSIPFSSAYSSSPRGMRYADRHARSCVIDLRSDDMLHIICRTLLMHAALRTRERMTDDMRQEILRLHSIITQLQDQLLGISCQLDAARKAPSEPVQSPEPITVPAPETAGSEPVSPAPAAP